MNENNKIKVSVLRLLAFSLVLCLLAVAVFSLSEVFFERLWRRVDPTSDSTKNARWVLGHAENLFLAPVLMLAGLLYGKSGDACSAAIHYKEKKIAFSILLIFMYLVFLPYYVTQNMAVNVSALEALEDKVIWFATQLIFISAITMYHSDRQARFAMMAEKEE